MIFASRLHYQFGNYIRCNCDDPEKEKQCAGYEPAKAPEQYCKYGYDYSHDPNGSITDACFRHDIFALEGPDVSAKEEIEEAKKHVKSMVLLNIIPAEAKDPPHEDHAGQDWMLECDAVTLLDALEAAESHIKELEAAGNKMRHSCILREACDEWDALIDSTNR